MLRGCCPIAFEYDGSLCAVCLKGGRIVGRSKGVAVAAVAVVCSCFVDGCVCVCCLGVVGGPRDEADDACCVCCCCSSSFGGTEDAYPL